MVININFPSLWLVGWLFTLGYTNADLFQAIMGIFAWPIYLGLYLH